ncbi:MAG TPA: hypothetical protein P5558_10860 [Geminicoccaceae bacterium]|nr:hypothetical protein [Geminicoccaceae bacterium]
MRSSLIPIGLASVVWTVVIGAGAALTADPFRPDGHFQMPDPAVLDPGMAEHLYGRRVDGMAKNYALSGVPAARLYRSWQRANRAPYRSATHGDRYVNNYVNGIAAERYGRLAEGEAMPVGSIIAKDAIAVDRQLRVFDGPLSIMEKMPEGYDPEARDWRYVLILPDGSIFADSSGLNQEGTDFCAACHQGAGDAADHLFFIPDPYSRAFRPQG